MKPKDRTTVSGSIYSHTLPDNTQPSFSSLLEHLNSSFTLSADDFASCFNKKIEAMRKLFPSLPHLPGPLPCTPHLSTGPHPLLPPQDFFLTAVVLCLLHQFFLCCCLILTSYSLYPIHTYLFVCYISYAYNTSLHHYKKTKQKPLSLDLTSSSSSSL